MILAGHNPASEIYVRNKVKACQALGVYSEKLTPPENVTTEQLLALIHSLNERPEIDGILVHISAVTRAGGREKGSAGDESR